MEEQLDVIPKKKSRKRVTIAIVMTAIITFGIANFLNTYVFVYLPSLSPDKNFTNKLTVINNILKTKYLYDVDDTDANEAALTAYVEGLGEPYTHYYRPEVFERYLSAMNDAYVGIGITVSANTENNSIEVVDVSANSPAAEAGIQTGDIITAVDGETFDGEHMSDAVEKIKSEGKGTSVTVTIMRNGKATDINVVRKDIDKDSVTGKMLENNIGYVRITNFNSEAAGSKRSTYTEFKDEVGKLTESGMQKMIIDLRGNPGGALDVMCDIADMIAPEGAITTIEYKNGKKKTYSSDSNEMNIPIAVLINQDSASASELLTICLKDYKKATVIGTTSFGKGIVQSVYPFTDGSGMSVTVAKYYSPNGVCIHGTGVEPDITVELSEEYKNYYPESIPEGSDTQLSKAIEVLMQ